MCVSVDAYKNKSPQSCESPDLGAGNQTQVFLQSTITLNSLSPLSGSPASR